MKIFIEQISDIVKDVFEELGYDRESGKVTYQIDLTFANINVMEHYLMQRSMKKHLELLQKK